LEVKGPGDGEKLVRTWNFKGNWREAQKPTGKDIISQSWIPPGESDRLQEPILVQSRDPADPGFLRPAKDSPLASAGVGGDLPVHVGAAQPEGTDAWDWQKTWEAQAGKGGKEKK
jgi:hypothetical protein